MRDVTAASVSVGTVSKALNNNGSLRGSRHQPCAYRQREPLITCLDLSGNAGGKITPRLNTALYWDSSHPRGEAKNYRNT